MRTFATIASGIVLFAAGIYCGANLQREFDIEQAAAVDAIRLNVAPKFKLGQPLRLPADNN